MHMQASSEEEHDVELAVPVRKQDCCMRDRMSVMIQTTSVLLCEENSRAGILTAQEGSVDTSTASAAGSTTATAAKIGRAESFIVAQEQSPIVENSTGENKKGPNERK